MNTTPASTRVRIPRIAETAVERARLTVVPRLRRRTPRVPFVILVSLLLVAGVVGLLVFNTRMQQNSFQATALEREAAALAAHKEGLKMELEELNNPQRVAERAKAMGMVEGPVAAFIDLRDGTITGDDLPPASAESQFSIHKPLVQKPPVLNPSPKTKYVDAEPTGKKRNRDTADRSTDRTDATGTNGSQDASQGDRSNR